MSSSAVRSDPPPPVGGAAGLATVARQLVTFFIVELGWSLAFHIFFRYVAWNLASGSLDTVLLVSAGGSLAFDLAALVLVGRLAATPAVRASSGAALARAAFGLTALTLVLDIASAVTMRVGGASAVVHDVDKLLVTVSVVVGTASSMCLWIAVTRLLAPRVPRAMTVAYVVVLSLALVATLPTVLVPRSVLQVTLGSTEIVGAISLARFVLFNVARAGVIWLFVKLASSAESLEVGVSGGAYVAADPSPARTPQRDVVVGALWLVGGVLVSVLSFSLASDGGGGRYVITTGAIAYGLVRVVRGLAAISRGSRRQ